MIRSLSLLTLLLFGLAACSTNDDDSSEPELGYFKQLVILNNIKVELEQNENIALSISGTGDLTGVDLRVDDEVLTISDLNSGAQDVVVSISHPDIDSITVRNSGQLEFTNDFSTSANRLGITGFDAAEILAEEDVEVEVLNVQLRNAALLAIDDLEADRLNLRMTDGTRCNIGGDADSQVIDMDNGCRFNLDFPVPGFDLDEPVLAESVRITLDNGARAWVYPEDYLNATGNNGSVVFHKGQPSEVDQVMTNGARLERKDD